MVLILTLHLLHLVSWNTTFISSTGVGEENVDTRCFCVWTNWLFCGESYESQQSAVKVFVITAVCSPSETYHNVCSCEDVTKIKKGKNLVNYHCWAHTLSLTFWKQWISELGEEQPRHLALPLWARASIIGKSDIWMKWGVVVLNPGGKGKWSASWISAMEIM